MNGTTIRLREFSLRDAPRLAELANDVEVSRFLVHTFPHPYTHEDAVWWIKTGINRLDQTVRAIDYEDELVGCVAIHGQSGWKDHGAEIGYWVGRDYWGHGIATEAVRLMSKQAFAAGFRKLFAPVLHPNLASMQVLRKNDYVLEGVFKDEVRKDGVYYDIHHFSRLKG